MPAATPPCTPCNAQLRSTVLAVEDVSSNCCCALLGKAACTERKHTKRYSHALATSRESHRERTSPQGHGEPLANQLDVHAHGVQIQDRQEMAQTSDSQGLESWLWFWDDD
eukprot:TRINITY_DN55965_c0_g1_i1.p2 TRINITY_DN55965_c0_g1~~TRINITY_DN55965_c0_g1_i1.p2  ORF type:complete len:111 (-),score=9.31 TRINITY_DN55965_c0_g1_i1:27-359(-)